MPNRIAWGAGDLGEGTNLPFSDGGAGLRAGDSPIPIEAVPDPVVVFDALGIIRGCNVLLARFFGYRAGELVGQQVDILFPEADRQAHKSIRQSLLARQREPLSNFRREVFARRRSGELVPVDMSMMPVDSPSGTVFVATIRDASRHTEIEKALTDAVAAAEEANLAKSRFLGTMSHELRTPLNSIIGFADLIERGIFGPLEHPKYADYVRTIGISARHLLDVINELIDLSLIEDNRIELNLRDADLRALIEECRDVIRPTAERLGLTLALAVPNDPVIRLTDPQRLRQVLINLLGNAAKFTDQGGIITVSLVDGPTGTTITVADTGIGIAPAQLERIFDLYSHSKSERNRAAGGLGIGLHVSKKLVESLGGRIEIESKPDVGTTVRITFPPDAKQPANEH